MTTKEQKKVPSSLRKQTVNYIFILAASLVLAGIYNFLPSTGMGIMVGVINIVLSMVLFFTAKHLQNGSIRSIYIGSLAVVIILLYGFLKDTRLIILSLVMPVIFYVVVYKLWKNGELN